MAGIKTQDFNMVTKAELRAANRLLAEQRKRRQAWQETTKQTILITEPPAIVA